MALHCECYWCESEQWYHTNDPIRFRPHATPARSVRRSLARHPHTQRSHLSHLQNPSSRFVRGKPETLARCVPYLTYFIIIIFLHYYLFVIIIITPCQAKPVHHPTIITRALTVKECGVRGRVSLPSPNLPVSIYSTIVLMPPSNWDFEDVSAWTVMVTQRGVGPDRCGCPQPQRSMSSLAQRRVVREERVTGAAVFTGTWKEKDDVAGAPQSFSLL